MNIYLVERRDNVDWDEYYGFVIASESPEEARKTHPDTPRYTWSQTEWLTPKGLPDRDGRYSWIGVGDIDALEVTQIGVAIDGTKSGIILTDFKAG